MEIIIYVLTMIIYVGFISRNIKRHSFNAFNIFLFMVFFAYLFVPTLVFMFGADYQIKYAILGNIYQSDPLERLIILFYVLIFTLCAVVFYSLAKNYTKMDSAYNSEKIKLSIYSKARKYWLFLLAVGLIGFFYMVYSLGGVSNLIQYSGASRGESVYEITTGSTLAYAEILSRALWGGIYPIIIMYELKPKPKALLGMIIMICVGSLLLVVNAGKLQAIVFFTPILIYVVNKVGNGKSKKILYIFIGIAILWIIPQMDNLFFYLSYDVTLSSFKDDWNFRDNVMSLANSFTYPFSNLLMANEMNRVNGLRFGLDYLAPFVNILPHRLLHAVGLSDIDTLYKITMDYYHSYVTGFTLKGGVPNDIITVAFRQLAFPGVMICGSIAGILLKYLDRAIKKLNCLGGEYSQLITTNCMVVVVLLFLEPYSAIMAYFHIIVSLFLTKSILHIAKNNENECSFICHYSEGPLSRISNVGGLSPEKGVNGAR